MQCRGGLGIGRCACVLACVCVCVCVCARTCEWVWERVGGARVNSMTVFVYVGGGTVLRVYALARLHHPGGVGAQC